MTPPHHPTDGTGPDSPFLPNWASKPGATISAILIEKKIPVPVFAEQAGLSMMEVAQLIFGELSITSELAERLSAVLGASAQFWLNRQKRYDEALERIKGLEFDTVK